jgi:hypothetical protein
MDLTNIGYTPAIPEDLNTFDLSVPHSSPDNSVFNYFRNADNSELGVLIKAKDNNSNLFVIDKKIITCELERFIMIEVVNFL